MSRVPLLLALSLLFCASSLPAQDEIPPVAWRIPIGQPPANPGTRKPELPPDTNLDDGYWQGAPVGGLGAGTFSRTYRGNFERWHVKAGIHKYENVPADQFSVFAQQDGGEPVAIVLSTGKPQGLALSAWNWSYPVGAGEYAALCPKSWYAYKTSQLPVTLTLEQFSPVIPNNYKESSYPVAVYNWYAQNPTDKPVTVSLMFSWTNMTGWFRDQAHDFGGALNALDINRFTTEKLSSGNMQGIVFDRQRKGPVSEEWDGQMAIATLAGSGVQVTYTTDFDPTLPAAQVWKSFAADGRLPDFAPGGCFQSGALANSCLSVSSSGEQMAGAIAVRFTLAPGEKKLIPMALSWDFPIVQFGGGRKWVRHYAQFFGAPGTNAWAIARAALQNGQEWSRQIDDWQKPYLSDESKPAWFRAELFNELYYLADGGTLWGHELNGPANPNHPSSAATDSFTYMECFDYQYYGTLDVRFYGSWPLIQFWPEIEKQTMREYSDTIPEENPQRSLWGWMFREQHKFETIQRKTPGAAPHDLGNPIEDPLVNVNQYNWQDVTNWRDLNSKYVLLVWRDYVFSGSTDLDFLRYNYKSVRLALDYLRKFDTDGDGLIENGGFPDQTYDEWPASGESAYCGNLYLAAVRATAEMARILGDAAAAQEYDALFKRAQAAFIKKLWNGSYFNYDTRSSYKTAIMSEQLAGQWYANLTGLGDLVPKEMRVKALQTIYDNNVMKFGGGQMGAVSGMSANGEMLHDNEQVQEVWTGATFSIASEMITEGMSQQAYHTAKGVYNVVWDPKNGRGYWFRTPEAYDVRGLFRASMYMRPTAIWAMEATPHPLKEPNAK
ncbi:MAG: non-lysosomal glucosylceramidase [Candidatus Acidiferrales bacterium]